MDAPVTDSSLVPPLETVEGGARRWPDWLGVTASVACAIHCAAMPFVIGFLPLLGLGFLADPDFHRWMVGVCLLLAVLAFLPGWRRHGRLVPGTLAALGLVLIGMAAFAGEDKCCPAPSDGAAVVAEDGEAACTASCCPTDEATAVADAANDDAAPAALASQASLSAFWHWMTPIGSVLLIAGHLVNRRCMKQCACPVC